MAIYHARVKTYSRAKSHSSVAAAAYRAGIWLVDSRTGMRHDYRLKGGVVETRVVAPDDAPDWAFDPARLWASAEAAERRRNATVARDFQIALPHELGEAQRSELVAALARALVDRYGFAVQASIHEPDDDDSLNWHVHILATTRRMGSEGLGEKTRELDGGPPGRAEVDWTREMVNDTINRHLEAAGIAARVDHRTLEAQAEAAWERGDLAAALALTREPTRHLGKHATALERKGERTRLGDANAAITGANVAAFDAALAAYHADGRAVPTPDGHSADRAQRDRQRERTAASPPALPHLGTPEGRRRAARIANREALVLWNWAAGMEASFGVALAHTARVMRHHRARLKAHIDTPHFAVYLRELLRRLQQLAHDAGRLVRRKGAAASAQSALAAAQHTLEDFDEQHPRPAIWSRGEWSKRRSRRIAEVARRTKAALAAREAIGETAIKVYAEQTRASAHALEAWSQELLDRYGLDIDGPSVEPPSDPEPEGTALFPPATDETGSGNADTRRRRPTF